MFTSTAQEITSWTTELLENTFFGRSESTPVSHSPIQIDENSIPDGFSILEAFSTTQDSNLWLMIQRIRELALGKLESITLYAVENGRLSAVVKENISLSDILRFNLSDLSSFALVRDSGLRRKMEDLGAVVLNGMMPRNAQAQATDVTEAYAEFKPEELENAETLAAYDISILNDNEEYQPEGETITVTLSDDAIREAVTLGKELSVWHLRDDGTSEQVSDVREEEGSLVFDADGFSVFVVIETKLTETVTTSDGSTYEVEVTYKNTSGIPMEGTKLVVTELNSDDTAYANYINASAEKLGTKAENVEFSRAFDIKIVDEADESHIYEPTGDVDVSIRLIGQTLNSYANLDVLHFVEKDGFSADTFEANTFSVYEMASNIDGETVQFTTDSFSVYVVIGHEGGDVVTPRVEFHFINNDISENNAEYTAAGYKFQNKNGDYQVSQILKNNETLEQITQPGNTSTAYFIGWYIVDKISDTTQYNASEQEYEGAITYTWPANPDIVNCPDNCFQPAMRSSALQLLNKICCCIGQRNPKGKESDSHRLQVGIDENQV